MWPFRSRQAREDREALTLDQVLAESSPQTRAGIVVGTDTALRLSAVWACVRLLADAVSTLPVDAYRTGSREPIDPKPALLTMPAAYTTFAEWVSAVMSSALLRGNAFGLVTARAGSGLRPAQVELLHPDRVTVNVDPTSGATVWRLDGREIDREHLWHFRAYPFPGSVLGMSPIGYAAESIGLGLAAQQYGAKFFGDDATPAGVLTTDQPLKADQAREVNDRWTATRSGRRGIAVLGAGVKFQGISIAPEESQFLDSQRFSVQQVARVYGVPPEMIGADSGDSMTYSNIEQRDLTFLKYAVGPWLTRLEDALGAALPRGQYVKFNTGALLRTDLKTRYESYEIGLRAGFLTLDEVRDLEDREPLPAVA